MALNSLKDLLSDNKALSVLKLDGVEFKDLRFPNSESYRGGWRDARVRAGAAPPPASLQQAPAGCCQLRLQGTVWCTGLCTTAAVMLPQLMRSRLSSAERQPPSLSLPHPLLQPEGEGCYTWADGSTYEGAWHAGLKHGWGTYRWPNGAWYCGEWRGGFMQVPQLPWCFCCGLSRRAALVLLLWRLQSTTVLPWCCCHGGSAAEVLLGSSDVSCLGLVVPVLVNNCTAAAAAANRPPCVTPVILLYYCRCRATAHLSRPTARATWATGPAT